MTSVLSSPPELYVLAGGTDAVASAVLGAAARRGVRALLCSRYEYAAALTVRVGSTGVQVTPDRPVLVRQHAAGVPPGPDAAFICDEVYAHVKGGLSLATSPVVNRPRAHGVSVLMPPACAQYHLRVSGALPAGVTLGAEAFRDCVRGGACGWEVQDIHTLISSLGGEDTICESPQRVRRRDSVSFGYVSVLVIGTQAWAVRGADSPHARAARRASVEIAGIAELQLAEVTFVLTAGEDTLELARVDANPSCFPASIASRAAAALLDLLVAS